jgi:hypothetical protein
VPVSICVGGIFVVIVRGSLVVFVGSAGLLGVERIFMRRSLVIDMGFVVFDSRAEKSSFGDVLMVLGLDLLRSAAGLSFLNVHLGYNLNHRVRPRKGKRGIYCGFYLLPIAFSAISSPVPRHENVSSSPCSPSTRNQHKFKHIAPHLQLKLHPLPYFPLKSNEGLGSEEGW